MTNHNNQEIRSEKPRTVVFTNSRDNKAVNALMEAFKQHGLDNQTTGPLPAYLDCIFETRSHWWLWSQTNLCIAEPLNERQLIKHYLDRQNLAFKQSKNKTQTELLIAEGQRYIEAREEDLIRRNGWQEFSCIQEPRYYIIHTITEIASKLVSQPNSIELVEFYQSFYNFIQTIQDQSCTYFPATRSNTGFRNYLQTAIEIIERVHSDSQFWLERETLSEQLKKLSHHVENYINDIAVFLMFCISPLALSTHLSAEHIRSHHRTLGQDVQNNPLFRLVYAALMGGNIKSIKFDIDDMAAEISLEQRQTLRRHYLGLVEILKCMQHTSIIYINLAEAATEHGESVFVKNQLLQTVLDANLKILSIYLDKTNLLLKEINQINTETTRGLTFQKGYTKNAHHANRLLQSAQGYANQINSEANTICQQIHKLLTQTDPNIQSTTSELIKTTLENLAEPMNLSNLKEDFHAVFTAFNQNILPYHLLQRRVTQENRLTLPACNQTYSADPSNHITLFIEDNATSVYPSAYDEITLLLPHLLSAQNQKEIKVYLSNLCVLLIKKQYTLYGGGETIIHENTEVNVPNHVKRMITVFDQSLQTVGPDFHQVRQQMFMLALAVSSQTASFMCRLYRFFSPRNYRTQELYDTLAAEYSKEGMVNGV